MSIPIFQTDFFWFLWTQSLEASAWRLLGWILTSWLMGWILASWAGFLAPPGVSRIRFFFSQRILGGILASRRVPARFCRSQSLRGFTSRTFLFGLTWSTAKSRPVVQRSQNSNNFAKQQPHSIFYMCTYVSIHIHNKFIWRIHKRLSYYIRVDITCLALSLISRFSSNVQVNAYRFWINHIIKRLDAVLITHI